MLKRKLDHNKLLESLGLPPLPENSLHSGQVLHSGEISSSRPRTENDERIPTLSTNDRGNYLFTLVVDGVNQSQESIGVFENDNPFEIATDFCTKHGIKMDYVDPLVSQIIQNAQLVLTEQAKRQGNKLIAQAFKPHSDDIDITKKFSTVHEESIEESRRQSLTPISGHRGSMNWQEKSDGNISSSPMYSQQGNNKERESNSANNNNNVGDPYIERRQTSQLGSPTEGEDGIKRPTNTPVDMSKDNIFGGARGGSQSEQSSEQQQELKRRSTSTFPDGEAFPKIHEQQPKYEEAQQQQQQSSKRSGGQGDPKFEFIDFDQTFKIHMSEDPSKVASYQQAKDDSSRDQSSRRAHQQLKVLNDSVHEILMQKNNALLQDSDREKQHQQQQSSYQQHQVDSEDTNKPSSMIRSEQEHSQPLSYQPPQSPLRNISPINADRQYGMQLLQKVRQQNELSYQEFLQRVGKGSPQGFKSQKREQQRLSLYERGKLSQEAKRKKQEQQQLKKEMKEQNQCTFTPKIDKRSKIMAERDRFKDNVEDILINKGNASKKDREVLKKELKKIAEIPYTHSPKISKKTNEIMKDRDPKGPYNKLYNDFKVQKENKYRLKAKFNQIKFDFEPHLPEDPIRGSIKTNFLERQTLSIEKRKDFVQSETKKREPTFSPAISNRSRKILETSASYTNRLNTSGVDRLYEDSFRKNQDLDDRQREREEQISRQSISPKASRRSAEIVEQTTKERLKEFFTLIDSDHDGLISADKIAVELLPTAALETLMPLFLEMEKNKLILDFDEFYDGAVDFLKEVTPEQRYSVIRSPSKANRMTTMETNEDLQFSPKINDNSLELSNKREFHGKRRVEDRLLIEKIRTDLKRTQAVANKYNEEMKYCTFQPNAEPDISVSEFNIYDQIEGNNANEKNPSIYIE